jgi:predicted small metal-binding protein
MRVIECDVCGDAVTAAEDGELIRHLGEHMRQEHGLEPSEDEVAELVAEEAYEAMDS